MLETRSRLCEELTRRLTRWRNTAVPIVQAALAAGLSWLVAVHIVDHRARFFAPVAAVVCLGITLGQRLRRVIELIVGVGRGVGVGDLLISAIGTMANRPRRDAGDVGRRLAGWRSRDYPSVGRLRHSDGDAVPARCYERAQPPARWTDRRRNWACRRRRVSTVPRALPGFSSSIRIRFAAAWRNWASHSSGPATRPRYPSRHERS